MVALAREPLVLKPANLDSLSPEIDGLPKTIPVQIDRTFGRFQAFEVSTTETIPAPSPAPSEVTTPLALPTSSDEPTPAITPTSAVTNPESTDNNIENKESTAPAPIFSTTTYVTANPTLFAVAASFFLVYTAHTTRPADSRDPDNPHPFLRPHTNPTRKRGKNAQPLRAIQTL